MIIETAVLGGGCFWCLEAIFQRLDGVTSVEPGYAGGTVEQPTYQQVCTGSTGHAEVIRVSFDSTVISFAEILEIFFVFHDPTTKDRQGPDTGTQYRSVILANDEQADEARATIEKLTRSNIFGAPILTEILTDGTFWPAEMGHRSYYEMNPEQAYCRATIAPKIAKLRAEHAHRLKP